MTNQSVEEMAREIMTEIALISAMRANHPGVPVIVESATSRIETLRAARDYIFAAHAILGRIGLYVQHHRDCQEVMTQPEVVCVCGLADLISDAKEMGLS
jgi:hypothetical protein